MSSELLQLDDLYKFLKEENPDWLFKTLHEKWLQTIGQKSPSNEEKRTISQHPIWPFDVTLTSLPQDLQVSEYVHFIRNFNWADTALGPMSDWSSDLRRMVNMCLCDKSAAAIWILPDHIGFYNEEYSHVAGEKHPHSLARPFAEIWPEPEVNVPFARFFDAGENHGQSTKANDAPFLVSRNGYREELWCSWSIIPIPDSNGGVFGLYNAMSDTTRQSLSARRLSALVSLGQNTALALSVSEFWSRLLNSCDENHHDVPFAILYSKAESSITAAPRSSNKDFNQKQWKLQGCVGIPSDHSLPSELNSDALDDLFYTGFSDALDKNLPFRFSVEEDTFPKFIQGNVKSRVHGDACKSAIALPISTTNREESFGFLILGLNPNIRYSTEYAEFLELFSRQCATSLASAVLVDDERQRSRVAAHAARQDRLRMSLELAESQQKATDVEARFKMMADLAPVAMAYLGEQGEILYANQNWYDITLHSPDLVAAKLWMENVHPLDEELVESEWSKLQNGDPVSFEMRWKKPFVAEGDEEFDGEKVEGTTWTIASGYPEKRADGSVKAFLGCLTDISRQKWMEDQRSRRMNQALEMKRQQENWMDMTSHECRNPLSAIMLCAESIVTMLKDQALQKTDPITVKLSTVESSLEGAEIIIACAQHQKRIIDDVLTLSKLDSGLLTICAVEVQPLEVISQALKMFDGEVRKNDIELTLNTDTSYKDLKVDWVLLDPSRLLQVLINLLTNAIKFTQAEPIRQIQVTLNATEQRPNSSLHDVKYIQDNFKDEHNSNTVFIGIEVIDTGRGLQSDEIKNLFEKFQQASPKTHVEYGGSGLGLFISKQLTRMQGGAMGVSSSGHGAKFVFYVQAPRCVAPEIATARKKSAVSVQERSNSETRKVVTETSTTLVDRSLASKQHILIVEDNIVNQKVMRNQLLRLHHSVNVANHGLEALDHVRNTRFCREDGQRLDVMLLDVEMPICNGIECASRIRKMEADGTINSHIPIIGVTANARAEQQSEALKWMDIVVTKPFRLAELTAALEEMRQRFNVT